ncbi:MAG: reverse transcriptase/maturase family protein [Prevotella sp.]|jgi:retron-type reverse transcriptase|nr:reverse transcriptase/maturase family protein [Prevotella sp.]
MGDNFAVSKDKLLEELFTAYFDARLRKRNKHSQLNFEINSERLLVELRDDIFNRRYTVSPGICFIVDEPVKREIFAADFRDRVVHHLLYNYLSPVFENIFIDDSYSCRKNKGTSYGIDRVYSFIRECSRNYTADCYVLKLDIEGYFMAMDKGILLRRLEEFVHGSIKANNGRNPFGTDPELLFYLSETLLSDDAAGHCTVRGRRSDWDGLPPAKSLFHAREGCGLPIGNLTSQLFSNVYLHPLDTYVRDTLGIAYYGRYVDDFILVHPDHDELKAAIAKISAFLDKELRLRLHPRKIWLQHYSKGVNFLGATVKPHRCYASHRACKNFVRCVAYWNFRLGKGELLIPELKKMRSEINSHLGALTRYASYNIRKRILLDRRNLFFKYAYLEKGLKRIILKKKALTP